MTCNVPCLSLTKKNSGFHRRSSRLEESIVGPSVTTLIVYLSKYHFYPLSVSKQVYAFAVRKNICKRRSYPIQTVTLILGAKLPLDLSVLYAPVRRTYQIALRSTYRSTRLAKVKLPRIKYLWSKHFIKV